MKNKDKVRIHMLKNSKIIIDIDIVHLVTAKLNDSRTRDNSNICKIWLILTYPVTTSALQSFKQMKGLCNIPYYLQLHESRRVCR